MLDVRSRYDLIRTFVVGDSHGEVSTVLPGWFLVRRYKVLSVSGVAWVHSTMFSGDLLTDCSFALHHRFERTHTAHVPHWLVSAWHCLFCLRWFLYGRTKYAQKWCSKKIRITSFIRYYNIGIIKCQMVISSVVL